MNFRIILHLLKTDWQRFRTPIIGMWVLLLISAAPWLLHNPGSFSVPVVNGYHLSGDDSIVELTTFSGYGYLLILLSLVMPALLATAVGMHDQGWQSVSPIRSWQCLAAKTLALFLYIVLPQLLLGSAISVRNGISLSFMVSSAFSIGLLLMLAYGTLALFARSCGSFGSWCAAITCLGGVSYLANALHSLHSSSRNLLYVLFDPLGNVWAKFDRVQSVETFVLVAALPWILRSKAGSVARIAAAISAVYLAALLSQMPFPRTVLLDRPVLMDSVQPVLSAEGVRSTSGTSPTSDGSSESQRLTASIESTGLSPMTFVQWQAGTVPSPNVLRPTVDAGVEAEQSALREALPAPAMDSGFRWPEKMIDLGPDLGGKNPASIALIGLVFRYRTVVDLDLGANNTPKNRDEIVASARVNENNPGLPSVELFLKCPARFVFGNDAHFQYVLHFPKDDICVGMSEVVCLKGEPPGGTAWLHLGLNANDNFPQARGSLASARLLVLQPEFLGTISRQLALPSVIGRKTIGTEDWLFTHSKGGWQTDAYHSYLRPNRPDPATCSEREFSRYLRMIDALCPSDSAVRDLAEYAPRFPRLLGLYARNDFIASVIESGVPESSKMELLGAVESPAQASSLAITLTDRDWQGFVRGPLLSCLAGPFNSDYRGSEPVVSAIARLEDPGTYPALLAAYEATEKSRFYEIIRHLPGITPALDKAVEKVSERLSSSNNASGEPFDFSYGTREFAAPVSHGNPVAFANFLRICQSPGEFVRTPKVEGLLEIIRPGSAFHEPEAWREFFKGKTTADFTYDPLARCWRPISKTH